VFLFPNNFFKNFGNIPFFQHFVTFGPSDVPLFIKSGATLLLLPKESRLKEIKPEFEGKFGLIYKMIWVMEGFSLQTKLSLYPHLKMNG